MKVGLKLCYRLAMKRDDVVNVQNTTNENLVFSIEDHARRVALVVHGIDHGLMATGGNGELGSVS